MLWYMDQMKTFSENLCCLEVNIDNILDGDLQYFALKYNNLVTILRGVSEWSIFPT